VTSRFKTGDELAVVVDEVKVSAKQREGALAYMSKNPGHGFVRALKSVGVKGTRGQLREFMAAHAEFREEMYEMTGEHIRSRLLMGALEGLPETVVLSDGTKVERMVQQPRLIEFASRIYLPEARVLRGGIEITGDGGGPVEVEVRHDFTGVIERLRQAGLFPGQGPGEVVDAPAAVGAGAAALLPAPADRHADGGAGRGSSASG
jgi:hypothetical protein